MTHKRRIACALGAVMALLAAGAFAETDHPWQFNASERPSRIVAPVDASGSSAAALAHPAYVENMCHGIKTSGMVLIFR